MGFTAGTLGCNSDCTFSSSGCTTCGDGKAQGTEVCDGSDLGGKSCKTEGYLDGTLACKVDCSALDNGDCTKLLDPAGIAISSKSDSSMPAVAYVSGQYLVVWTEVQSNGDSNIVGARVDAAGKVLDPGGIDICSAPEQQSAPAVAFDGTSYLVVWQDHRPGSFFDIYGKRVSTTGALLDNLDIAISTAANHQISPAVASAAGSSWWSGRTGVTVSNMPSTAPW